MKSIEKFRFAIVALGIAFVLGCGGGADVVAPKSDNPDPNLKPAGRGTDSGSPATSESSSVP